MDIFEATDPMSLRVSLALGADVNAVMEGKGRTTALINAVRVGDMPLILLLLESGASVNQAKSDGATPLYIAVQEKRREVVELLLGKKAEVDAEDEDGMTPLFAAARGGHAEEARMLLAKGADANRVAVRWTALTVASYCGHLKVAEVLLDYANPRLGVCPLTCAVEQGDAAMVELLLARNVPTDRGALSPMVPLVTAVRRNHLHLAKMLLEKGANVDRYEFTHTAANAIQVALRAKNLEAVKMLVAAGANLALFEMRADNEISRVINASKRVVEEACRGNVAYFMEAIEAGELPKCQWSLPEREASQLVEWVAARRDAERACYAALYRGKARGTVLRLRECDDMRRLVASYLVASRRSRACVEIKKKERV